MQLVLQCTTTDSQRRLDEIVATFTPAARRICPHLGDDTLRALIERMAHRQLAAELRRPRQEGRGTARTRPRSARPPFLRAVS
jgi:hypothetical protein